MLFVKFIKIIRIPYFLKPKIVFDIKTITRYSSIKNKYFVYLCEKHAIICGS